MYEKGNKRGGASLLSQRCRRTCQTGYWSKGFTLAEVLITLAIIGIVAAMTIPTLINNYRKREALTRIKTSYSVLNRVFKMAQADYGDPILWASSRYSTEPNKNLSEKFVNTYIKPYMHISKVLGWDTFKNLGFKYSDKSGNNLFPDSNGGYVFFDNKGIRYSFAFASAFQDDVLVLINPYFHIDINGTAGPNVYGKDLFVMEFNRQTGVLEFRGEGYNRDILYNNCKTSGAYCGALLKYDGWEMKDKELWD